MDSTVNDVLKEALNATLIKLEEAFNFYKEDEKRKFIIFCLFFITVIFCM